MNKRCGYTLIEILMVILLVAIFTGIVTSTYRFFMQEGKSERVSVAREMDLLALQTYLRKLIGSIGFGIPATETQFINITDNNTKLEFKSLYAADKKLAGCWWMVVDLNGTKAPIPMAVDKYGKPCNATGTCILLSLSKELLDSNVTCSNNNFEYSGFLYYSGTNNPFITHTLTLMDYNETNPSDLPALNVCARGSKKLMVDSQPLFDCVGGLLFEPMGGNPPTAIRYCMLLQVSGRMTIRREPPLSSTCGNFNETETLDNETLKAWSYYRWRVIEEVIPLENLKGLAQ